jgi:PTS system fructose-specific IIC component
MSFLLKKSKKKLSFIDLLKQDDIVFTDISSKEAVIKELSRFISLKNRISEGNVFAAVMEREAQLSTGLANYLAIPHARINIQYPLIAAAVNKNGIEFNSLDGLPAKFIIILLTPLDNPELQLKLLAEISKSFRSIDKVNDLINSENPSEIISKLKQLS